MPSSAPAPPAKPSSTKSSYTKPSCAKPRYAKSSSASSHHRRPWDLGFMHQRMAQIWSVAGLRRRHREADNLLALQPAQQARHLVLLHRFVAELQPEQAALRAVDDRGLIIIEQCGDVG